jgi:hypothetical protein
MLTKFFTLFTVGLIVSNLTCFANEGMGTSDNSVSEPVTSPVPSVNMASEAPNNPEVSASNPQAKEQNKRDLARKRHRKGKHRRGHRKHR